MVEAKGRRVRVKAYPKEAVEEKDCFVEGFACLPEDDKCEGIPRSNRCAACRRKKNFLGIPNLT